MSKMILPSDLKTGDKFVYGALMMKIDDLTATDQHGNDVVLNCIDLVSGEMLSISGNAPVRMVDIGAWWLPEKSLPN